MNEHESNPDWEDRLVDVALNEAIGDEAPPDLSEQILAASMAASADEPAASPLPGDQAMNDVQHVQITRRKNWTLLAVAASLLVAVGLLTFGPAFNEPQVADSGADKRLNSNQSGSSAAERTVETDTTVELPEFDLVPVETTVTVPDRGTVLRSGPKRLDEAQTDQKIEVATKADVDGDRVDFDALMDNVAAVAGEEVKPTGEDLSLVISQTQEVVEERESIAPTEAPIAYPEQADWADLATRNQRFALTDDGIAKPQATDSLMMGATPRIVIAEGEEEEKLSIDAPAAPAHSPVVTNGATPHLLYSADPTKRAELARNSRDGNSDQGLDSSVRGGVAAAPTPNFEPESKIGLSGEISDAYAAAEDASKDTLGKAGERRVSLNSMGRAKKAAEGTTFDVLDESLATNEEAESLGQIAGDLDLPARNQSFNTDHKVTVGGRQSYGAQSPQDAADQVNLHQQQFYAGKESKTVPTETNRGLTIQKYEIGAAITAPLPSSTEASSIAGPSLITGRAAGIGGRSGGQGIAGEQLGDLVDGGQQGESAPSNLPLGRENGLSSDRSLSADEKKSLQEQLVAKKQALIDLEVMKHVASQQANSPAALEVRIEEEMQKDAKLQSLQAEQFTVTHQLTQLKSTTKNRNSSKIEELRKKLREVELKTQDYYIKREGEVRDRLKSSPNDMLAAVETEYKLRKRKLKKEIADIEARYAEKSGEVAAALTPRGEVTKELNNKIVEYQQLASRGRGLHRHGVSMRLSELSQDIKRLRRRKIQLDAQNGVGPDFSGDKYSRIYENPFVKTVKNENNYSTFSIDVDTASYANTRQFLMQSNQLPPPDAVRLEELINYFDYDYSGPDGEVPFASHVEVAGCPWNAEHRLVRIGIKGHEISRQERPKSNLVFLMDVSGSMDEPAKLPLLVEGMKLLTRELGENDKVAIVVYASSEGLALPSTRGDKQQVILDALNRLSAGGSTAGGAGIQLAYKLATENFIEGGVNRVILCTDGDFNVGVTSPAELERMAERKAKNTGVFLTVLGFGRGNLNDSMMERISGKGNGNYHYVDNLTEARKVLVEEMAGTLVTIAKNVKIQVDFNPYQVAGYRLLGYENRILKAEDFKNDKVDAGEIGAGHTVTALYEIVPAGTPVDVPPVDPSKYIQPKAVIAEGEESDELLTLHIRYMEPDGNKSKPLSFPITDEGGSFAEATSDFQFASAVASFGMLLRNSEHKGNTSYSAVAEIAGAASERDPHGYRAEFLQIVQRAKQLSGE